MSGLASSKWALPSLSEFFEQHVQKIDASSLPSDDSSCFICREDFGSVFEEDNASNIKTLQHFDELPFAQIKNTGVDEPLRLPCGHILGSSCLQTWWTCSNTNSCPLCKRELFIESAAVVLDDELEYARRDYEIQNLPLRTLLKGGWYTADGRPRNVFIPENYSEILAKLPIFMFKIAVRIHLHRRPHLANFKDLVYPPYSYSISSPTPFRDFASNYLRKFYLANGLNPSKYLSLARLLLSDIMEDIYTTFFDFFDTMADKIASVAPGDRIDFSGCLIQTNEYGYGTKVDDVAMLLSKELWNRFGHVGNELWWTAILSCNALLEYQTRVCELEEEFGDFWELEELWEKLNGKGDLNEWRCP